MKITIDTQHDRMEDIEKIISLLTSVMQQKNGEIQISEAPVDTSNLMNMFNAGSAEAKGNAPVSEPNLPGLLSSAAILPSGLTKTLPEAKPTIELY